MLKVKFPLFILLTVFVFLSGSSYTYSAEVENLILNGGFEDGITDPWTTYGTASEEVVKELKNAKVPEKPVEGEFCLHVTVTAKGANFWDSGLQHVTDSFKKGKKYTLSAFLKCKEKTLQINFKPELAKDPWNGYGEKSFTMNDTWAEYSTTTPIFAADVNPSEITFHIAYDVGEFWIDSVRFYEGDYVAPEFGGKPKAVDPEDKVTGTWGKIKAE